MMLKVYGQGSSRTFRVWWLCRECGVEFQKIPVSIREVNAQANQEWYKKLNPNERIPTIDDDGFILWESAAINIYLSQKSNNPLWPETLHEQARVLQWGFFVANDIDPPVSALIQHWFILSPDKRDSTFADLQNQILKAKLKILDSNLKNREFFSNEGWGMSDFLIASSLAVLPRMRYSLADYPNLEKWLDISLSRPSALQSLGEWEDLLKDKH